ncbi:MAG: hypothetical protein GX548_09305 [Lentisphaerae bacterium]|nr:hypothetical protein [Lentisphaerota bacterium]
MKQPHARLAAPLAALALLAATVGPALVAGEAPAAGGVSRPAGYVRVDVPAGGLALAALPFDPFAGTLAELLEGQLGEGDSLLVWDADSGAYASLVRAADGSWAPAPAGGAGEGDAGEGDAAAPLAAAGAVFWLRNSGGAARTAFLSGGVVLDAAREAVLPPGRSFASYPFLRAFAAAGPAGAGPADRLLAWDAASAAWLEGGAAGAPPRPIPPGEGFAFDRAGAEPLAWSAPRPWPDPFPAAGGLPRIEALEVSADPPAARLLIRSEPGRGRPVHILFQDVPDGGSFDPFAWRLAGSFETGGSPLSEWADEGAPGRPPVTAPRARCYLAVCGLADADGDGVVDGLEAFLHKTDWRSADTDRDGLADGWELARGLAPRDPADASASPFGDGFTNLQKFRLGLDPRVRAAADASGKTALRILTPLE